MQRVLSFLVQDKVNYNKIKPNKTKVDLSVFNRPNNWI